MSSLISPSSRRSAFLSFILLSSFSLLMLCAGCGGGGSSANPNPTPVPTATPVPTPTPTPVPFAGVSIKVGDATVPPGGIFQYQLLLTEPKPIGNGSTRPSVPNGPVGPVRGVAINDASGQAVGIAVINGSSISVSAKSPNLPPTFGTDISYPLFTLTMPVNANATPGATFPVNLDGANSIFVDPSGAPYIQEIVGGTLTIAAAGKQSITDVLPGGGLLPDRSVLRILGQGFTSNTRIAIEGTTIIFPGDTTFVGPNEIDVKLCNGTVPDTAVACPNTGASFQLDGERVRATNKDTNEVIEYFTYSRTDDASTQVLPATSNALVALVHPMFSRVTYAAGTIPFVNSGTQFTGIAFQNITGAPATIKVELLDGTGTSLNSASFTLPTGQRVARDVADLFPAPSASAVTVRATVTAGSAIEMLGMLGDTAAGTVTPVVVTAQ
jgi:hypothetical protein